MTPVLSNLIEMPAVASQHARCAVALLPVGYGFQGTTLSAETPLRDKSIGFATNAGVAGTPGFTSWSHPV